MARFALLADVLELQALGFERADQPVGPEGSRDQAVRYEERGPVVSRARTQRRAAQMIRDLRKLGYRVEFGPAQLGTA